MAPAVRDTLARAIQEDRGLHPQAFARVAMLRSRVVELDARKRGPVAVVGPLFANAGGDALYPLIELVAFGSEQDESVPVSAWRALRGGALEALGRLRDERALPVLGGVLEGRESDPVVLQAAADALGRIGTDDAVGVLTHALGAPQKQLAALHGLGVSHRKAAADELARVAAKPADTETRLAALRALGEVGAAWAFKASVVAARGEEESVRSTAARALVSAFLRETGELRTEAGDSLLIVAAADTGDLLRAAKASADAPTRVAIDGLLARL